MLTPVDQMSSKVNGKAEDLPPAHSRAVRYRAYEFYLVACAKRVDTALSFCGFDGLVGQGENLVYDPSGARLRLFPRSSSNS